MANPFLADSDSSDNEALPPWNRRTPPRSLSPYASSELLDSSDGDYTPILANNSGKGSNGYKSKAPPALALGDDVVPAAFERTPVKAPYDPFGGECVPSY